MSKGMAMKCLTGIYFEEKYDKTKFRIQKIARMFEHPTRHSKAALENVQTFSPTFEPLLEFNCWIPQFQNFHTILLIFCIL